MIVSNGSGRLLEGRHFDPYGEHRDDPYAFLSGVWDDEPVFYAPLLDAWCVSRREDILAVLKDDGGFSTRDHNPRPKVALPDDVAKMFKTWRGSGAVGVGSLDPPEHSRIREVLNIGFTPARVSAFEPTMQQIAAGLVEQAAMEDDFEFISTFAVPYALEVICRLLGIPEEQYGNCRRWSEQRIELMMLQQDTDPALLREYAQGLVEFGAFARAIAEDRLANPQDDLISELLHSGKSGNTLSVAEVAVQIPTLIFAGHMTCAEALGTILYQQLLSPEGWRPVVEGRVTAHGLVEEGLRFDSPLAGMYRTATRDVVVGDVHLMEGSRLLMLFGAAGRDGRAHACPAAFAPNGKSSGHLAFGYGIHFCLGAGFARAELRVAVQAIAARMPGLTLVPGQAPKYRPVFPLRALRELHVRH